MGLSHSSPKFSCRLFSICLRRALRASRVFLASVQGCGFIITSPSLLSPARSTGRFAPCPSAPPPPPLPNPHLHTLSSGGPTARPPFKPLAHWSAQHFAHTCPSRSVPSQVEGPLGLGSSPYSRLLVCGSGQCWVYVLPPRTCRKGEVGIKSERIYRRVCLSIYNSGVSPGYVSTRVSLWVFLSFERAVGVEGKRSYLVLYFCFVSL